MGRIGRSWGLVRASWGVLRRDVELTLYPVISCLMALLASAVLLVPVAAGAWGADGDVTSLDPLGYAALFVWYVVCYGITIFFNAALVGAADIRLRGGDPTLSDGMRIALSRLPAIIGWALISATVGMVLRAVAERGGVLGAIAASVAGLAWNLITFLVVPVLVIEGVGPLEAARRSGTLLRRTWGEQVIGNVGVGLVFGLLIAGVVAGGVVIAAALASVAPVLGMLALAAIVAAVVVLGVLASTLGTIFSAALYRYAASGQVGGGFAEDTLRSAFRTR
jgi:hypothetical protein